MLSMEDLLAVFTNSEAAFPASLMPMVTDVCSRGLSALLPLSCFSIQLPRAAMSSLLV